MCQKKTFADSRRTWTGAPWGGKLSNYLLCLKAFDANICEVIWLSQTVFEFRLFWYEKLLMLTYVRQSGDIVTGNNWKTCLSGLPIDHWLLFYPKELSLNIFYPKKLSHNIFYPKKSKEIRFITVIIVIILISECKLAWEVGRLSPCALISVIGLRLVSESLISFPLYKNLIIFIWLLLIVHVDIRYKNLRWRRSA